MSVMAAGYSITDFDPTQADRFRILNEEWLNRYFRIEPIDARVLGAPQAIIDNGGAILYGWHGNEVVGCVALKHHGDGVLELTKMAVTDTHQGAGLGRLLGESAIGKFHQLGGRKLFLETHSSLIPAIRLYESLGFEHAPPPVSSDYERSDTCMIFRPAGCKPEPGSD